MPLFEYKAVSPSGETVQGTMEAATDTKMRVRGAKEDVAGVAERMFTTATIIVATQPPEPDGSQ